MKKDYAKDYRDGMVRAFAAVKSHLNEFAYSDRSYICLTLRDLANTGVISVGDAGAAKSLIALRIGDHGHSLSSWLVDQGYHQQVDEDLRHNQGRKLQATRQAWLDSLIKEFSA